MNPFCSLKSSWILKYLCFLQWFGHLFANAWTKAWLRRSVVRIKTFLRAYAMQNVKTILLEMVQRVHKIVPPMDSFLTWVLSVKKFRFQGPQERFLFCNRVQLDTRTTAKTALTKLHVSGRTRAQVRVCLPLRSVNGNSVLPTSRNFQKDSVTIDAHRAIQVEAIDAFPIVPRIS